MEKLIDTLFNGCCIAGILIGLGLLLYSWNSKYSFHHNWMKAWLFIITIHQLFFFLNLNNLIPNHHVFNLIGYPLALVHLPLLYFNILALTRKKGFSLPFTLLHFVPYTVCFSYLAYLYLHHPTIEVINGFLKLPKHSYNLLQIANGIPMALSGVGYVSLSFWALTQYRTSLKKYYAKLSDIDLQWIKSLVKLISLLFITIYLLIFFSTDYHLYAGKFVFRYVSISMTCFVAYYSFRYQKQIEVFFHRKMEHLKTPSKKYAKSSLSEAEMQQISSKISLALSQNQLFLDEEFTLSKLANEVNESSQRISETLNRLMRQSFYEFVNSYRIAQAKKMLKNPSTNKLSIEGIAFDCGFKSKSTFFKLFKKETGLTPTQFKKE